MRLIWILLGGGVGLLFLGDFVAKWRYQLGLDIATVGCCSSIVALGMLSVVVFMKNERRNALKEKKAARQWTYEPMIHVDVTKIDRHTVRVSGNGRHFNIFKDRDGLAHVTEVNEHGKPIDTPIVGASNAWQYGKTRNSDVMNYVKARIRGDI